MAALLNTPPAGPGWNTLPLFAPGPDLLDSSASLIEIVGTAVQSIPETQLCPVELTSGFPTKAILAVLVYCYATETYSAAEIRKRHNFKPVCRSAGGADFPTARELSAFRKANRCTVEKCLVMVLRNVENRKAENYLTAPPNEEWIADEARRRVLTAACWDSLELDDDAFPW